MTKIYNEIKTANQTYAENFGDKANLALPPGRHFFVLTCMDARLDPAKFLGLSEGDAHVFRNAGGRVTEDAIRSLVISHKLLGTTEWFIIHHTDCGMEYADDKTIAELLEGGVETAIYEDGTWRNPSMVSGGCHHGHDIKWLTISDPRQAVLEDVEKVKSHPLVDPTVKVRGMMYDVKTGQISDVE
jgi:carbonic anhydrase